ncbi:MAG: RNA 2',3'-cyclic phosphodiesterase [Thermodesulfobacteriota bacterium]
MRLFIAALLPEEIRQQLTNYVDSFKNSLDGVKWEKSEKLHITLKFLGDVEEPKLDDISNSLGKLVSQYSPFSLNLTELGGFPNLKKPRILYHGLSNNPQLANLAYELEGELNGLGFEKENRKFVPHITLGRVKKKINIEHRPPIVQTSFQITQIGLIKSELRPGGSVYSPVKLLKLEK